MEAGEIALYRISMSKDDAARQTLNPPNTNVRNKVWTSRDLQSFYNSEYIYATYPIDLALFWGTGGR